MSEDNQQAALSGIRVVELTTNGAGPLCGQILGDFGAEVIKLEPLHGDSSRGLPPLKDGQSGQFHQWNRNKMSVAVDLKSEEGLAIARSLVAKADVFLENGRAGVADKLGMGHAALKADNEQLIYISINGFGKTGPYSGLGTFDPVIQALTGFLPLQGANGTTEPIRNAVVDKIAGICGALSVLAAICARTRHGCGQAIDLNMLNAYASFILPEFIGPRAYPDVERPASVVDIHHMLECSDGSMLGLIQKTQLKAACEAFDRPDLLDDPRFATGSLVILNARHLMAELSKVTRGQTRAQVFATVLKYGLPLAPVNTIDEFFADPQVLHNETYLDFPHPELGPVRVMNSFARMSETPPTIRTLAPRLGEHTEALLTREGFDEARIADLRARRIIN